MVSPYDRVVRGEDDGRAPRLAAAWTLVCSVLKAQLVPTDDRVHHMWALETEFPALEFGRALAEVTDVSESSIRNLLLAAQRHGLVTISHRYGGKPFRVRAFVRWGAPGRSPRA